MILFLLKKDRPQKIRGGFSRLLFLLSFSLFTLPQVHAIRLVELNFGEGKVIPLFREDLARQIELGTVEQFSHFDQAYQEISRTVADGILSAEEGKALLAQLKSEVPKEQNFVQVYQTLYQKKAYPALLQLIFSLALDYQLTQHPEFFNQTPDYRIYYVVEIIKHKLMLDDPAFGQAIDKLRERYKRPDPKRRWTQSVAELRLLTKKLNQIITKYGAYIDYITWKEWTRGVPFEVSSENIKKFSTYNWGKVEIVLDRPLEEPGPSNRMGLPKVLKRILLPLYTQSMRKKLLDQMVKEHNQKMIQQRPSWDRDSYLREKKKEAILKVEKKLDIFEAQVVSLTIHPDKLPGVEAEFKRQRRNILISSAMNWIKKNHGKKVLTPFAEFIIKKNPPEDQARDKYQELMLSFWQQFKEKLTQQKIIAPLIAQDFEAIEFQAEGKVTSEYQLDSDQVLKWRSLNENHPDKFSHVLALGRLKETVYEHPCLESLNVLDDLAKPTQIVCVTRPKQVAQTVQLPDEHIYIQESLSSILYMMDVKEVFKNIMGKQTFIKSFLPVEQAFFLSQDFRERDYLYINRYDELTEGGKAKLVEDFLDPQMKTIYHGIFGTGNATKTPSLIGRGF